MKAFSLSLSLLPAFIVQVYFLTWPVRADAGWFVRRIQWIWLVAMLLVFAVEGWCWARKKQ